MTIPSGLVLDVSTLLDEQRCTRPAIRALSPQLDSLRRELQDWRRGQPFSFYHLPFVDETRAIRERATRITQRFARTMVFGIGGSSLGGEMLVRSLGGTAHPVRFFDNIDPSTLAELERTDWHSTALLVISKSGNTAETLAQFLSLLPRLEADLGTQLREHVQVITENRDGALAHIATELGLDIVVHPPVGGRYSVLSVVGLLPAAIAGVDVVALLAGARAMAEECGQDDMLDNPAFFNGAAQYLHAQQGRSICVFMPYADRLRPLGLWYRQLWAESLGKHDQNGRACGLTPALAMGVTDQHSQLQLYLDGPDDKQFSLLADPNLGTLGGRVPERFSGLPATAPLVGHTTGELLLAEFRATRETLTRHKRPNRTILLDTRNPATIGALILLLELETVVVARLLNIDPFDQPAVEESKVLAREYLKRR
ncbi:MAG: glucose-6-phosphate isomerase [Pseudomonadota bacterium]